MTEGQQKQEKISDGIAKGFFKILWWAFLGIAILYGVISTLIQEIN